MDLRKYYFPVPRYTSYPTVPLWNTKDYSVEEYTKTLKSSFWESSKEVSLYIHLPFCESLCIYCACNTRITTNHKVEEPYIDHVLREWDLYVEQLPDKPIIREIHLGGGTPTFFSPRNLEKLINGLLMKGVISEKLSMSLEGHPANTTDEHLRRLKQFGFDRLSLGIQDFDLQVQKFISRIQSFEQVQKVMDEARDIGYSSINYDVVYGLPGQTMASLSETIDKIATLSPDRISYYSYAHVPTVRPAQKSYATFLPTAEEKFEFMQMGKQKFVEAGYEEVGMDHFVKPGDELILAQKKGELHRNFMGYTPFSSRLLIGLGVSAISDSWTGFAQNEKVIEKYYKKLELGQLPIVKGHLLTPEDLFIRKQILNLMCNFKTSWNEEELIEFGLSTNYQLLEQLANDNFIKLKPDGILVLPQGKEVIRVICSALDARLNDSGKLPQFSKSI